MPEPTRVHDLVPIEHHSPSIIIAAEVHDIPDEDLSGYRLSELTLEVEKAVIEALAGVFDIDLEYNTDGSIKGAVGFACPQVYAGVRGA